MNALNLKIFLATFTALLFANLLIPFITEPFSSVDELPLSDSDLEQLETDLVQHLQGNPDDASALAEIELRYDIELYLEPNLEPSSDTFDQTYESDAADIWLPEDTDVIWTEIEESAPWIIPLYLDEPTEADASDTEDHASVDRYAEPQWLAHIDTGPGVSGWLYEVLYLLLGTVLASVAVILILRNWSRPLVASKTFVDQQLAKLNEADNAKHSHSAGQDIRPTSHGTKVKNEIPAALAFDLNQLITQLTEQNETLRRREHDHIAPYQDLLHAIAHEFRSPMARLTFGLEMLSQSKSDEDYSELHNDMALALGDMDDLVKEVLNYVRLRDNRAKLEYQEIHILEVVNSLIAKQQTLTPSIEFEVNGPNIEMNAVRHLFERVMINLVRNAARFANKHVAIQWQNTDQGVTIYVEDDGIGVPIGKRERIFEPFTRLDPSRSRDSGGVGLGLSIVDTICQQHKGHVRVEDSELGGARFVVFFPNSDH